MQDRQFRRGGTKPGFIFKETQHNIFHQVLGVGACIGGNSRKLRFLLGCEVHFHAL